MTPSATELNPQPGDVLWGTTDMGERYTYVVKSKIQTKLVETKGLFGWKQREKQVIEVSQMLPGVGENDKVEFFEANSDVFRGVVRKKDRV